VSTVSSVQCAVSNCTKETLVFALFLVVADWIVCYCCAEVAGPADLKVLMHSHAFPAELDGALSGKQEIWWQVKSTHLKGQRLMNWVAWSIVLSEGCKSVICLSPASATRHRTAETVRAAVGSHNERFCGRLHAA
jgi:hypothetical protein